MKQKTINLTEGSILKNLFIFSLPILAGQLFQTLYHSVDSIVVGNFVGTNALAAVTASGTIAMFITGFFNGMSTGASVVFARYFGARSYRELDTAIHTTMLFSIILGVLLAGLGAIFTPGLLKLVTCPDDVFDEAKVYLMIYMLGILFMSIYNIEAGVLRAIGDSSNPFRFLVVSSVLNIVLDLLFVIVFNMGVAGVAIATVIAQFVSVVLGFWQLKKLPEEYRFNTSKLKIDRHILGEVIRLGLPAGIQASITSLSSMYIQRYINSFSPAAIAGIGSGMKIDQFAGMPCQSFGLAITTYIGQNIGAGKYDRTHKGVGVSVLVVAAEIIVLSIPIYFFAPQLVRVFGADPEMIEYGAGFLKVIMPLYLIMGASMLFGGVVRGYGYSMYSMLATIFGFVVVRQIWLAITLNIAHEINYIYYCYPIGWAASALSLVLFYLFVIRKKFTAAPADK